MTKEDFLAAYNIGHRDGKEDVYCPNDYDDIFNIEQQSCENCCNGNQEEKAKLCQKSYIAGMEHNCEDEQVIRIKKGTLKARTGKYVVYDVEWLKKHFDTTEAKIYGQSKAEGARGDIPLQQSVPKMPQPNEHTETHECDCISRKAVLDALHRYFADGFDSDKWWNSTYVLDAVNRVPSATPQPKVGRWIGHREHCEKLGLIPSGLGVYEWCSNCGHGIDIRDWYRISHNYCPECGVKMQEVQQ